MNSIGQHKEKCFANYTFKEQYKTILLFNVTKTVIPQKLFATGTSPTEI